MVCSQNSKHHCMAVNPAGVLEPAPAESAWNLWSLPKFGMGGSFLWHGEGFLRTPLHSRVWLLAVYGNRIKGQSPKTGYEEKLYWIYVWMRKGLVYKGRGVNCCPFFHVAIYNNPFSESKRLWTVSLRPILWTTCSVASYLVLNTLLWH